MKMTDLQRQDYNALSREDKKKFDSYSKEHPNWEFEQVLKRLVLSKRLDSAVEQGGADLNPEDPTIWIEIMEGVKVTLSKFKSIGVAVFKTLDKAIGALKDAVSSGMEKIRSVIQNIRDYFNFKPSAL